jgi:hypothetical protein
LKFLATIALCLIFESSYPTPGVKWQLGYIDPKLGLSKSTAVQLLRESADVWNKEAKASVLSESPKGFKVNFFHTTTHEKLQGRIRRKKGEKVVRAICYSVGGNPVEIRVFGYKNKAGLRITLAHEFGHALGLPHSENKSSLMYKYPSVSQGTRPILARVDKEALRKVLSRR